MGKEGPVPPSTAVGGGGQEGCPPAPTCWRPWDLWKPLTGEQAGWVRVRPLEPQQLTGTTPFKSAFLVASSSGALRWAEARQGGLHWGKPIPKGGGQADWGTQCN